MDWGENQLINFRLSAALMDDSWYCTCKYQVGRDEDFHLLAILKRNVEGGDVLQPKGFYSYIEVIFRNLNFRAKISTFEFKGIKSREQKFNT